MARVSAENGKELGEGHSAQLKARDRGAAHASLRQILADAYEGRLRLSWPRRLFIGVFGILLGGAALVVACVLFIGNYRESASLTEYVLAVAIALFGGFIVIYALGCLIQGVDVLRYWRSPLNRSYKTRMLGLILLVVMCIAGGLFIVTQITLASQSSQSEARDRISLPIFLLVQVLCTVIPVGLAIVLHVRHRKRLRRLLNESGSPHDGRTTQQQKGSSDQWQLN